MDEIDPQADEYAYRNGYYASAPIAGLDEYPSNMKKDAGRTIYSSVQNRKSFFERILARLDAWWKSPS